jgi:hypothetical protein
MNCFEHPQKPALGTCTYCGRGLCRDCTAVVQGKLACRGSCEGEIQRARQFLQKSERAMDQRSIVYETSGNVYHQAFAITALFGLGFVVIGTVMMVADMAIPGAVLLGLGVIFTMRAVGFARAGRKFKSLAADQMEAGSKS